MNGYQESLDDHIGQYFNKIGHRGKWRKEVVGRGRHDFKGYVCYYFLRQRHDNI